MRHVTWSLVMMVAIMALAGTMAGAQETENTALPLSQIAQSSPLLDSFWFWKPDLSWGGAIHQDSFFSKFEAGSGVWDLGLFTQVDPGCRDPQYFEAVFGIAPDATHDAAFEIVIRGNPCDEPELMRFQVSQNNPRIIALSLAGLFRLQVAYQRIAGDGNAVMIEPKVQF